MQATGALLFIVAGLAHASAANVDVNPMQKTMELIAELKAKVIMDGDAEEHSYQKYADWCGSTARDFQFEIDTATSSVEKLSAKVKRLSSDIEAADTKVEELSFTISKEEKEVKDATNIRKKEAEEFVEAEKALMTMIDTLERAISVLEKDSASSSSSLAQIDAASMTKVLQSLSAVSDAAALSGDGMQTLSALLQNGGSGDDEESDDDDGDDAGVGAPAAAKFKKKSGSIIEVMQDMKDRAESQLADLRKHEVNAKHSYQMLKESLDDSIAADMKELDQQKSAKAQAEEDKASTEGDLVVAKKTNEEAEKMYEDLKSTCQTVAGDHEANAAARKKEIDNIDEAMKVLEETTGGAVDQLYTSGEKQHPGGAECAALSFVQVASRSGVPTRAVEMVQSLARQHHSRALAQLASKISATMRYSQRNGADPFLKVKALIVDLIARLEKEMSAEAQEKAYCDEEMVKTKGKYDDLEDTVASLTAKIDTMASRSAKLKEEVSDISREVAAMEKAQAESDLLRSCENAAYSQANADLELGLGGVRKAMTVLRRYYGQAEGAALIQDSQDTSDADQMTSMMQQIITQPAPPEKFEKSLGAGGSIISILEVIDSDFAKNLATEETQENDSSSSYVKTTQDFKVSKAKKEQDSKYKTQEFKSLDKTISELSSDKATDEQELAAVTEYYGELKVRCIAKPMTYEERKAKREAEIQGLKEALAALEADASAIQIGMQPTRRGHLRGDSLSTD